MYGSYSGDMVIFVDADGVPISAYRARQSGHHACSVALSGEDLARVHVAIKIPTVGEYRTEDGRPSGVRWWTREGYAALQGALRGCSADVRAGVVYALQQYPLPLAFAGRGT